MRFLAEKKDDGKLLRAFLAERGVKGTLLARLKRREDGILRNGERVTVRAVLREGDEICLGIEDRTPSRHVLPRPLPLSVVLEGEGFLVVNKPADMPTHPSHGHFEDTLANALVYHYSTPEAPFVPRLINRLDRNTTGAVLVAKDALSAATLSCAMAKGQISKSYLALVHGCLAAPITVEADIRRREASLITREVCAVGEGEYALTFAAPLFATEDITLVRLTPKTGRTHQLRVHMAHIGHPLLGDDLYGYADGFPRHALHAVSLRFPAPRGEREIHVRVPLPLDMRSYIQSMGREAERLVDLEEKG